MIFGSAISRSREPRLCIWPNDPRGAVHYTVMLQLLSYTVDMRWYAVFTPFSFAVLYRSRLWLHSASVCIMFDLR